MKDGWQQQRWQNSGGRYIAPQNERNIYADYTVLTLKHPDLTSTNNNHIKNSNRCCKKTYCACANILQHPAMTATNNANIRCCNNKTYCACTIIINRSEWIIATKNKRQAMLTSKIQTAAVVTIKHSAHVRKS